MTAGTSARVRLLHMRDEIESLSRELAGQSFEIYRESYGLRRITERAIQIVSEAARALPEELRARYPDAPCAGIIGIGNPRCGMNVIASTTKFYGKPPPPTCQSCNRSFSACLPNLKAEHPCERRHGRPIELVPELYELGK